MCVCVCVCTCIHVYIHRYLRIAYIVMFNCESRHLL